MAETRIRKVEYLNVMVKDRPGEAYKLLSRLKSAGVNLLAFNVVPVGWERCQMVLFPDEESSELSSTLRELGVEPTDPQRAFLVQGDDELGALAEIHMKLFEGKINVYASIGVTDGRGGYGYIFYVKEEDFGRAAELLEA